MIKVATLLRLGGEVFPLAAPRKAPGPGEPSLGNGSGMAAFRGGLEHQRRIDLRLYKILVCTFKLCKAKCGPLQSGRELKLTPLLKLWAALRNFRDQGTSLRFGRGAEAAFRGLQHLRYIMNFPFAATTASMRSGIDLTNSIKSPGVFTIQILDATDAMGTPVAEGGLPSSTPGASVINIAGRRSGDRTFHQLTGSTFSSTLD
ncbi:hypothetical protein MBM_01654 [Drepanopeziza brunnea f. sp. 'multigermtubi' MB_m1]|uniref:Uncharacterized protein n=1 Tax=Marssonina brunnea f. sp. multigermtubi (strain MB_m1) TaxID=1072389 RepID=K1X3X6_MARBU|nr:uncharacterized protein MBM_01654 [Drepanopeziza brunnea f. sp. 'multigermtubi' MB_m1]EKD19702.1 hypothetical protein MBM_01654 [Drepanopeziza brunnea f. sp. 'multigermtubi' MB_m1]